MKKESTPEERAKKYGCDGYCYGGIDAKGDSHQICGGIDTCEETRHMEAFATIFVFVMFALMFVLVIAVFIAGIVGLAHFVVIPLLKYLIPV